MKKKYLLLLIALLGIILVITGLLILSGKKTKDNNSDEQEFVYNSLFELSSILYKNNSYLSLPKNDNGAYYLTVFEYKKRNYNPEFIDSNCLDDFPLIYFDVENKEKYDGDPIYIVKDCKSGYSSENKTPTNLLEIANWLYSNGAYFDLPKDNMGVYYMTIAEYKKRNFNLEFIDTTCSDDFAIIYFDVENKDRYEVNPIYIIDSCNNVS